MNALLRVSRAVSLALCAALVGAAVPQEAYAQLRSVPRVAAPVTPAFRPGAASVQSLSPAVALPAASLGVAPALSPAAAPDPARVPVVDPAPEPVVDRPGALTAPSAAASPARASVLAPAAAAPSRAAAAFAPAAPAAADAPEGAAFRAEASASAVADAPAIARGFAALRRAFSMRRAETLAAADAPSAAPSAAKAAAPLSPASRLAAADDGQKAPPAPPARPEQPAPEDGKGKGGIFGLGLPALAFIGALLVAQVGVEAMGNAMPVLVQEVFGSFTVVAQIAIFSSIAGIIGRQVAPMFIQRHGLRKVYLVTEVARMLSISAMLVLLATGHMTLLGMMAFYSINGLVGGVALTAETSIPPALVGQDELKLQRFWTWEQTLLEVIGILGPIAAGSAVDAYGAATVLIAYPIAFLAAIAIFYFTLRIPAKIELMRKADLEESRDARRDPVAERGNAGALLQGMLWTAGALAAGGALAALNAAWLGAGLLLAGALALGGLAARLRARLKDASGAALSKVENLFGAFFARIARGARIVWSNPLLRYGFLAYSAYMMLNPFLYSIIAPAYGLLVGGQAGMGGIFGTIAGLYSLGGLLGGLYMAREQSRVDKALKDGTMTPEQVNESLRKSMIRIMMWTIPTLAAFATVFLPNPAFLAGLAVPYPFINGYFIAPGTVTLFALALVPFGFAQVISTVKLRSYFQAKVTDPRDMADAMGFFGSASLVISTIGLQSLSWLFQHTAGLTPFLVFAGVLVPLALAYFLLTRKLDRSGR